MMPLVPGQSSVGVLRHRSDPLGRAASLGLVIQKSQQGNLWPWYRIMLLDMTMKMNENDTMNDSHVLMILMMIIYAHKKQTIVFPFLVSAIGSLNRLPGM